MVNFILIAYELKVYIKCISLKEISAQHPSKFQLNFYSITLPTGLQETHCIE